MSLEHGRRRCPSGPCIAPALPIGLPVDDAYCFWRFADLQERRIVTDRVDLHRKQQRGFPQAVKFSTGQGAVALFPVAAVKAWVCEKLGPADPDARLRDRGSRKSASAIENSAKAE